MAKNSCKLAPEINGQPSRLYNDLLEKKKLGRPFTNWLYASYIASNAADAMDTAGYRRNDQGEHNADDVYKFLKVASMLNEIGNLPTAERQLGAADALGQRIDFTDGKLALEKADDFNDNHTGLIAYVVQHGDIYNIIVAEKNAVNHTIPTSVKEKLQIWDVEKQAFRAAGIDIENMPQELSTIFTPYNTGLVPFLQNLQRTQIGNFHKKYALVLFNMDPNSAPVQRLIQSFARNNLNIVIF